jgi:hypothetical protein
MDRLVEVGPVQRLSSCGLPCADVLNEHNDARRYHVLSMRVLGDQRQQYGDDRRSKSSQGGLRLSAKCVSVVACRTVQSSPT